MHVSECVLIMAISIFMIIASLLLFARSINLHLLPADWQLNLTGHRRAPGIMYTHTDDAVVHKAYQQSRGIVSHLQGDTHIQAGGVIDIHPCGCNHRRLASPAVWGSFSREASNPPARSSSWTRGGRWNPLIRAHQYSIYIRFCTS